MSIIIFLQALETIAYELNQAEVTEQNGIFQIRLAAILDTPAEYIREVLTDYTHVYRLSSSIVESEILPSNETDVTRVRTRVLACVSVFCREIERVDAIRTLASGDVRAEVIPDMSEFRSGRATWTVTAIGDRSEIVYMATMEPDFFIPPVVGIPAISHALKREYIATFERLEKIARINAERDWSEEHTVAGVVVDNTRTPCRKKLNAGL